MADYNSSFTGKQIDERLAKVPDLEQRVGALSAEKLDANKLPEAINTALAQAKDSGEFDGKNGTSVTVSNVSESTASGGTNVVTFSDGKKLNVKNGTNGSNGKTPVKGTDYWTPSDQEEIVQQVITALGTPVFGRVDENKNLTLTGALASGTYNIKYEYEDGTVVDVCTYNHDGKDGPSYTNLLPLAINSDKTLYNGGQGWKTGYRLNSSGAEAAQSGIEVTGFMPAKKGDIIYFSGIAFPYDGANKDYQYFAFYNADFSKGACTKINTNLNNGGVTYDEEKNMVSLNVEQWLSYYGNTSTPAWFRFSATEITANSIVTVNQPIE